GGDQRGRRLLPRGGAAVSRDVRVRRATRRHVGRDSGDLPAGARGGGELPDRRRVGAAARPDLGMTHRPPSGPSRDTHNNRTEVGQMINNQEPKVTLLSHTELPLETVYSVWEASKG